MWCLIAAVAVLPAHAAEDISGLEDALRDIQTHFPAEVSSDALYRAALEGVAQHLDAVMGTSGNRVLTATEQDAHTLWMAGHRSGIGAEFSIVPGRGLLITEVFESGPAEASGLKTGDLVVSMDDHPFTGLSPAKIHTRVMRNRADASVFDVRRADGEVRRLTVERGPYTLPVVRAQDSDGAPVARLPFFGHGTADALSAWLKAHRQAPAVVLDVRDNEGGSLDEVVKTADLFLEPGAIVVNRGQHGGDLEPVTASTDPSWVRNVVVLVNQGTAGAAEAFAAALRDNGRCVLVGTRTGGRAVDSSNYDAGRGFVLQVADIHLATPGGSSWNKRGLAPNVVVEATDYAVPVGETGQLPDLQRDTAVRLISSVR